MFRCGIDSDKRPGKQRMVFKVRHIDHKDFGYVQTTQSDFMEEIYCKNYQCGPKIRN